MLHLYRPPTWHPQARRRPLLPAAPLVLAGFDFDTEAGLVFGDLAGALTGLARESAVGMVLRVYAVASPGALVHESGTLTTDANGRLARYEHASLGSGTAYHCMFIRSSDGEITSAKLTANT